MMNENVINTPGSRPNDGYKEFEAAIRSRMARIVQDDSPLFKTNVLGDDLWDIYLNNLPEEDGARQHYNCNACKHFMTRYAGLVTVDENGQTVSVLWDENEVPKFFKKATKELRKWVENKPIKGIFISDERTLGIPKTGEWTHISAELPKGSMCLNTDRLLSAGQVMAAKKEEYKMFCLALRDIPMDTVDKAINLLESGELYRGNKFVAQVKWFKEMRLALTRVRDRQTKENLTWLAVAMAPKGFVRIRSSVLGPLFEDIQEGLSLASIKRRFREKTDPSNYMRSQSEPNVNAIKEAEKVIEKLGIADSLERRYLTLEEIPEEELIWKHRHALEKDNLVTAQTPVTGRGVFAKLLEKKEATPNGPDLVPTTTMTWEKFKRTMLPQVRTMEAKVDDMNRLMALVTAVHPESENILQWNNPVSWYYHGGIDAEIKKRVEEFGGRYENNVIRCSLIWEGRTDLDLHCITPHREHIYYSDKRAYHCSGYLDLDMNGLDKASEHPVENMRWKDDAPNGTYKFYVHNYSERVNRAEGTPFKVELEINGKVYTYDGAPLKDGGKVDVFEFYYEKGKDPQFVTKQSETFTTAEDWNITANGFAKVDVVTTSPNLWGDNNLTQFGNYIFFILDECKDLSEGKGRGFFNETLISDLRPIRKTLEAFMAMTPIEGVGKATACGLGFSDNADWNLTLRVVTNDGNTKLIKIDRFD